MKKNILLLLVSSLLSLGTAQGAHNHEPSYPATATIDITHPAENVCPGEKKDLKTTNTGNHYDWYKFNESTNKYEYSTSTGGQTNAARPVGKYLCAITKENSGGNVNLLTAGNFNFQCHETQHRNINGDNYFGYTKDGITYLMRDLNCYANNDTYPGGFTCIKWNANEVKPRWFEQVRNRTDDGSNMLVCDGMNSSDFRVWIAENIQVQAGVTYEFSCKIANVDNQYNDADTNGDHGPNSLPRLRFWVEQNGKRTQLSQFDAPRVTGEFKSETATFKPTSTGKCTIYIQNYTTFDEGNDFAIDDIYFGEPQSSTTTKLESFEIVEDNCSTTATETKNYTPCIGTTCTLSPVTTSGTATWKDNNGNPVTNLTINIVDGSELTYKCTVETTGSNGYPLTITETHTINPQDCGTREEATINYPAQCKGTPITLTAQAEGTYLWQNGTTTRTIAIDEASDQTMTCIVTQNNGGITNTITETHIVKTIECRSTTMCNTGDSILKAQVTGDYYEWTLADGITKETIYTTNALTISPVTASAGDILTYTCEVYEYPATTSTLPSARPPMLIATESFVVTITNCKTQATDREQVREDGSITIEVPGENRCMNCTYRWYKIDTNGNITVLQDSEIPTYTYNNAKDGEIFCDVKDDQERISHTQKYIIVTYKPEPESICYDTELTKTLEGETSETDNYEWYWLKNDTEVEFPAEAITIEGNKATLNLEYFVKQTNSTEPIVVNVLQKYEVEVEVSTTEGSNNEGGEENEEEGESDDTGTHRLAQIDELEIYFEQKVTDISSVNDTKKILISDNGTLEEYDDTYFKISDSYIYQDPFGSKVGNMDSHEGHLKFTDTPMNAPQAYTGDRADNKYFVEVDGGDTAGPVFSIIANGKISKGDKYILSFLATDTSGYPTESPADIQFTININNSDDIDLTPRLLIDHNGWKRYTYPFEVPLDGEEVIITLSNYNTSSGQNDFAIDEITFTLDKTTDLIPDVALPEDRSLKLRNSELRNSEFQMWRKEFSIIINQVTSESIIETAGLNKEFEKEVELPNETITFIYDPNTSQVNGRTYQDYKVSTNQYGCEHHVYFTLNLVSIEPMIFFSPNNDGLNDLWLVKGIESAPDAYIMIYDRYSKLLYKCKGSEFTGWDGNYNGHGMVQDDYWYVISIPETEEQISGHFTLKR